MDTKPYSLTLDEQGEVSISDVKLVSLAQEYGTPLYVLDKETIVRNCARYIQPLSEQLDSFLVLYAGKANLSIGLINLMAELGMGLDVVSGGELYTALHSNMLTEKIYFHGNNKSYSELKLAIESGVKIVVDNEQEAQNIIQLCEDGNTAQLLIRMKPEIEAHTHEYIKTGQIDSKFGVEKDRLIPLIRRLQSVKSIDVLGIHCHIGSQIFQITPFEDLVSLMTQTVLAIKTQCGLEVQELNMGGGIGIKYTQEDTPPNIEEYIARVAKLFKSQCQELGISCPKLLLEPGRSIVGNAGVTLYTVGTIKEIPGVKNYLFVDGGMADNPRPIMYQADYTFGVAKPQCGDTFEYAIAGKFCESGDVLTHSVFLPKVRVGDILVVYSTGAYNYAMASNYNRYCKPAMVLLDQGNSTVLVRRERYEDITRFDIA